MKDICMAEFLICSVVSCFGNGGNYQDNETYPCPKPNKQLSYIAFNIFIKTFFSISTIENTNNMLSKLKTRVKLLYFIFTQGVTIDQLRREMFSLFCTPSIIVIYTHYSLHSLERRNKAWTAYNCLIAFLVGCNAFQL